MINTIPITAIIIEDRMRKDYGDVASLAASIKEFGLIQPIVLAMTNVSTNISPDGLGYQLVAGGRRLAAIKQLGWKQLEHGRDWVIRDEAADTAEGRLRLRSIELEENLRRKDMTWPEQVAAKAELLRLMESIHGVSGAGHPTADEQRAGETSGFGVRKLAAMLGESIGAVSQDLTLAGMVKAMPTLAQQESKSSARRIGTITVAVALMKKDQAAQQAAKAQAPTDSGLPPEPLYKLYEGDWRSNIASIADESVDLVYTDLPYGVNLDQMGANENVSAHGGALSYTDSRDIIIPDLAKAAAESFRVLKPSRFAVFFFGFNYYNELLTALISAGFQVNPIPVVWLKHQQFTQSPTKRYANGYEQALVAMKGSPTFVRPGQVNVVDVPGLVVTGRYQVAQQPVALVERFIKDMILTNVGSSVLDLYAGTGTTGVAALSLGCIPILFERDPEQCPIIRSRLAQVAATLASRRDQEAPTAAAKS